MCFLMGFCNRMARVGLGVNDGMAMIGWLWVCISMKLGFEKRALDFLASLHRAYRKLVIGILDVFGMIATLCAEASPRRFVVRCCFR